MCPLNDVQESIVRQQSAELFRLTAPMAIAAFIDSTRPQIAAMAASVLAKHELATTVAHLAQTTAAVHEQMAMLEAEYKLTADMQAELAIVVQTICQGKHHQVQAGLEADTLSMGELIVQRQTMLDSLTIHLADLRQRQVVLAHGIEHGNIAMTDAFCRAAVGALTMEPAASDRATGFIMAYLVVALLKDRLQAPGFRGLGENAVTTLYVTALCHCAKRRMEHALTNPMANALAMELSFKSAKEVHEALQGFHQNILDNTARARSMRAQMADSHRDIDSEALPENLLAQQFADVMQRAQHNSPRQNAKSSAMSKGARR